MFACKMQGHGGRLKGNSHSGVFACEAVEHGKREKTSRWEDRSWWKRQVMEEDGNWREDSGKVRRNVSAAQAAERGSGRTQRREKRACGVRIGEERRARASGKHRSL